jgi:hypothetical protein
MWLEADHAAGSAAQQTLPKVQVGKQPNEEAAKRVVTSWW